MQEAVVVSGGLVLSLEGWIINILISGLSSSLGISKGRNGSRGGEGMLPRAAEEGREQNPTEEQGKSILRVKVALTGQGGGSLLSALLRPVPALGMGCICN